MGENDSDEVIRIVYLKRAWWLQFVPITANNIWLLTVL